MKVLSMGSQRRSEMMGNDWEQAIYTIQVYLDGQIVSQSAAGVIRDGFGIHEIGGAWNVTHLATGWNCFTAASLGGAKIIAQHLIDRYLADFERLKITGTTAKNYRPLEEKIIADRELAQMKKRYGDDRPNAENEESRMRIKILS